MSRRVDIILGSDIYESIVLDGKLEENGLHLRNTIFGWVMSGKLPRETTSAVNSVTILKTDIDLRKFWEIEEVHSPKQPTAEEMQCEQHFLETTQEAEDGRFKVKLPFKPEVSKLGESFTQARRRFMSLERRLIADPELHERYRIFIREFMDLGHLEEVPLNEIDKDPSQLYYLPHHCVFKEELTTTKLRVVFDGSAKTSTGQSLNESLMVGAHHLNYLKASLKDEAATLLAHLPLLASNYQVGIKLLENQYSNKRLILKAHMEAIHQAPSLHTESAESLRRLQLTLDENLMAMEAMKIDTSLNCFYWVHIIYEKLDAESRRQWELDSPGDNVRKINELREFIAKRARALEASDKMKQNQQPQREKHFHTSPKNPHPF